MFGIGGFELILILLFAFLVFGPDKLPEVIQTANKALQKFRKAQQEFDTVLKKEMVDEQALKSDNPLDMIDSAAKKVEKSQESFAERKARYDQQRQEAVAQKPAPSSEQNGAAKSGAATNQDASAAAGVGVTGGAGASGSNGTSSSQDAEGQSEGAEEALRPAPVKAKRTGGAIPSADELYGLKPTARVRKSAPKSAAAAGGAAGESGAVVGKTATASGAGAGKVAAASGVASTEVQGNKTAQNITVSKKEEV
ncbi:MAG: twin-arginine translocase TatA/TatE family subunit [Anaerotardibacter sp.]